jgi:hypothetical protein
MAVWSEARVADGRMWTCPEFPGYDICQLDDDPSKYVVWSSAGPIGNRPKFAEAEQLVKHDQYLVASATQVNIGRA